MAEHGFGQSDQQINRDASEHQAVNVLPDIGGERDEVVERIPETVKQRRPVLSRLLGGR